MSNVIELTVNGTARAIGAPGERSLLSVLRDDLGLTGSKIGCGEGACGACTVLLDGQPARACITPATVAAGRNVMTIESLAGTMNNEGARANEGDEPVHPSSFGLHPLQQAFLDCDALQCGYCTPGMIMAALGLLGQHPDPSEDTIVGWMQGNICRCGAYPRIIRAIRQAAAELRAAATGGTP
jgi:aerobic-type carbon monoxide dehydrogenase small subunit (CoxS/CutS family)